MNAIRVIPSFLLAFALCTAVFAAPREDDTHRRIEMTAVAADGALAENLAKYGMNLLIR